jgi:hypothetical protein
MKMSAKKVQGKFSAEEFVVEDSSFFEAVNSSPKHSSQVFVDEISSSKSDSRKKNVCLVEFLAKAEILLNKELQKFIHLSKIRAKNFLL